MNNVLYLTSELFPLIKTGGLADVAGSLPPALTKLGQEMRILLPAYPEVMRWIKQPTLLASGSYYNQEVRLFETRLPESGVITWLVHCPAAFDRPGGPYIDGNGEPWHDNALRFAIFCLVAVDIALNRLSLNWQPDIVHGNDWQSGLVPALLQLHQSRPATLFTIHNLAYQGLFDYQTFLDLNLPARLWHPDGLEFYGQLSFIKGGLAFADRINTVSPTYAREILQPEFGYGLEGLLRHRRDRLSGILNGIDSKVWNPQNDKYLQAPYGIQNLQQKSINKTRLQQQLGLPVDAGVPLIGMISRLVEQKGLEIILQGMADLLAMPAQLIIVGTGDIHYELQLTEWASRHPEQLKVIIGYNEPLSHRLEAASDLFLMPSSFEPCGLNQIYSLRYGTLPVVRNVGGLADTVVDANTRTIKNGTANGFVIPTQTSADLLATLQRALELYLQTDTWQQLQITAMGSDYSWNASAEHYRALYHQAMADRDNTARQSGRFL
ncbi:glycogen synthase GlgA [Sedimenticola selenatireducens]|uniref:glycogen synthase GlgA n=1 Tax=Sedimenticola selenatireducens TaxID=191960 RepID=UPI002AABFB4C|nr:glycogen synthase GlgA [Sedimenticola selenatireducens]